MRGVYEAIISISGLNSARTLIYLTAPSTSAVEILSASVTNKSYTTNEQHEVSFHKVSSLGTPTATTITPTRTEQGSSAASSTVKGNVTASEPTYTSAPNIEVGREGYASLGGWRYQPLPEERLTIAGGDTWGIRMLSTPTSFDSIVRLVFRELG